MFPLLPESECSSHFLKGASICHWQVSRAIADEFRLSVSGRTALLADYIFIAVSCALRRVFRAVRHARVDVINRQTLSG
jgi:hypothetical protein